jgi:hypothetical protein
MIHKKKNDLFVVARWTFNQGTKKKRRMLCALLDGWKFHFQLIKRMCANNGDKNTLWQD